MKIYSVTIQGGTRYLWQSYQSATQSLGYWERKYPGQVQFETVHVPEDAWKPVDKATESRLNRVAVLWEQLVATDQDGLDSLLDDLVKRLVPKPKPVLSPVIRGEAEALLKLDRLVDAG